MRRAQLCGFLAFAPVAAIANHCGAVSDGENTISVSQAIIGGSLVDSGSSPVVFLRGPQGTCTAVLVAPNLVATARHCAAVLTEGAPSCDPSGELAIGTTAGELGADDSPGSLSFYAEASVAAGNTSGAPDAVGIQIISTESPSVCRDDLSFIVLNQPISGVAPVAIRIDRATPVGEPVSVVGYGLTENVNDPIELRMRTDGQVTAVGPDTPPTQTQPAPLRSIRVGPGATTCSGDSGGPFLSNVTGAMIALVSLGHTAAVFSTSCTQSTTADTTGPRLADYQGLIQMAFSAAGATPIPEATIRSSDGGTFPPPAADASPGIDFEAGTAPAGDAGSNPSTPEEDGRGSPTPSEPSGGCAIALESPISTSFASGWTAIALAGLVTAARRRRR